MLVLCYRKLNRYRLFAKIIALLVLLFSWLTCAALPMLQAAPNTQSITADTDFPLYLSIKPNVEFWISIFTKYSNAQGVFHDTQHLDIIYEIVKLDPSETLRANKKNKKIKKAVIEKYKKILIALSKGGKAISKDEKRVAAMFGSNTTSASFRQAASNIRCQTGLQQEFKDGLIRSGAVIDKFKQTFRSHGLPLDLVYLPCVESSFNFRAYSKFGASGIWQFTHGTGRQYMKIGYVVDERRDPYISTDAAARLLKKNYAALKEWPLAITAYNHGLAGMMRAKKSKGSYENIVKSYKSRSFKFASRNFYSEFLAARSVALNPEKYFGPIAYHKPVRFQVIKTKGFLPVKELSDQLNISILDIQRLNPSLRNPVFNEQKYIPKGFNLKLPDTVILNDMVKRLASVYKAQQKPSRFHRVQKGDTAGSIARTHSVRLDDLILSNGLNRRAMIYIGQNLRIPVKDEIILAQKSVNTVASKNRAPEKAILKKPALKKKPIEEKTDPVIVPEPPSEPLAEAVTDVTSINPNIVTGNLRIIGLYQKKGITIGTIAVEAEETLGHYADWLKIPTQKIRALNRFKYGTPISIDQKIKLPLENITAQEFEVQRYEFHKEIEEDFFESFSIQGVETYVVKNGDSIWRLCIEELEIPFWLLKKYNPEMKFSSLVVKQKILYPIILKR